MKLKKLDYLFKNVKDNQNCIKLKKSYNEYFILFIEKKNLFIFSSLII